MFFYISYSDKGQDMQNQVCTFDGFYNLIYFSKGSINREYVCSVVENQKYLTRLSFLPAELDIFDIRQHNVRILFICQRLIC